MRGPAALYALVAAIALAASAGSLRNGFVFDDVPVVVEDTRIRELSPRLLVMPYWAAEVRDRIYRPVTTASLALDYALGNGRPLPFHLTNILLHVAVCLLVLALARRVLGPGPGALVAASWFALHPVHVEVFAGVVGRSELIAALGYLVAVLAWLAQDETEARRPAAPPGVLMLVVLAGAVIALGGKEHAITLPGALLLADAWTAYRTRQRFVTVLRTHTLLYAGVLAVAAGYLALRGAVLGNAFHAGHVAAGLHDLDFADRLLVMLPALFIWVRLMIWPVHLSADYSPDHFTPLTTPGWDHVAALLLLAGVIALGWTLRRKAPAATFGLCWFVVTVAVTANILVPTGVLVAERVLYLPSVGIALVAGALWESLRGVLAGSARAGVLWPATALALALLAARTLMRIPVFRDNDRFFGSMLKNAPESYRSHWAAGGRAFQRHDLAAAEREFLAGIRIYSDDAEMIKELGEQYLGAGMWAPADRFLTAAWRLDSTRYDAAVQAVFARLRLGFPDSALRLADEALRRYPRVPTLLMGAGEAWLAKGQPVKALTYRRRMAFAFPGTWQYQHIAADGAARAGRCAEARQRVDRALALAPDSATAPRRLRALLSDAPPTCGVPSP